MGAQCAKPPLPKIEGSVVTGRMLPSDHGIVLAVPIRVFTRSTSSFGFVTAWPHAAATVAASTARTSIAEDLRVDSRERCA